MIQLGSAAGYRVWTTSRDEGKRARALEIGADKAFSSGERLPERVDAVLETVGAATWSHSINSLKPGGTVVISGATSGDAPAKAELTKIFFKQLRVVGSTMGNRAELERLANFVVNQGITPVIDSTFALADARQGFEKMAAGDVFGKVVFTLFADHPPTDVLDTAGIRPPACASGTTTPQDPPANAHPAWALTGDVCGHVPAYVPPGPLIRGRLRTRAGIRCVGRVVCPMGALIPRSAPGEGRVNHRATVTVSSFSVPGWLNVSSL